MVYRFFGLILPGKQEPFRCRSQTAKYSFALFGAWRIVHNHLNVLYALMDGLLSELS
jgi:hypothetical protein